MHVSSRVHKNIRPESILIISDKPNQSAPGDSLEVGTPYLTDWTMLRKIDSPSSMVGENDWLKDLYRHPRRQGLQPEERYNMGHDIYSLGVCLLVIGLWEPLITDFDETKIPSEKYRETMLREKLLKATESARVEAVQQGVSTSEAKAVNKILTRPALMEKALRAMASHYLPTRMGLTYTRVVNSCLTCLEGGFGDVTAFQDGNKQAVGIMFKSTVLQPLSSCAAIMGSLS